MAGYQDDFSRSNNAAAAERRGCLPASRLAKQLGVRTGAIRALLQPAEWHHTSKMYNQTDYYDLEDAEAILDQLRAWRPPTAAEQTWSDCTVTWLEWGGTRKRPTATERTADGCTVTWKTGRRMCVVTLADGTSFRKGIDTRGFEARDNEGRKVWFS